MARDAPADTAGPSSPPPQLPEGWLAQWEGVQRKWYYVQRTTGKSQWEIPTEPVVLTPSTTPISIGTGPSQAPPSRPSTNSPQVRQENTLAERIGSLADGARISSSMDAQLNAQSQNPPHGSSETGWYTNQLGQHFLYHHGQRLVPGHGGYNAESQQRGYSQNTGMGPTGAYSNHPQQVMGQQAFGQPYLRTHWVGNGDGAQGQSGSYNLDHTNNPYQGHAPGPIPFRQQSAQGAAAGHLPNPGSEHRPSEPAWQVSHQPVLSNPGSQWTGSSNLPQLYFGSQYTPQAMGSSTSNMAPQSSHFSNPLNLSGEPSDGRTGPEPMHGSFNTHSGGQLQSPMGYPLDGSHSQQVASFYQQGFSDQAAGAHSAQGYQSQPSSAHGQYHSTSMARAQSGPGFGALGFPAVPDTHGNSHQYQNPLVQVGAQQYLPQQQADHLGATHQYHPGPPTVQQGQRSGAPASSRIATSDPQFISGPWASSTPPSSGAGQPSQQG
ncbi:uncharacterized protein N7443_010904 [Penicillium atrosanguineum]|uniref:uncharacterized protein n=1 Tax=Penicillium atrosanguineum TaxID=1132637 RepID=UPI002399144F|nr:uncharacterized protein N7443_010904 [Penicillium atrosanguineum]KAJ5290651.1 hypothetical protein N7443_010904 [Penicillium atrosanguineum]